MILLLLNLKLCQKARCTSHAVHVVRILLEMKLIQPIPPIRSSNTSTSKPTQENATVLERTAIQLIKRLIPY